MWRLFGKWMRSTSDEYKLKIRYRLALVYAITAWNTLIYVFYLHMKDNLPTDEESKIRFVEKMKKKNTEVEFITIQGFSIVKNKTESVSEEQTLNTES